MTWTLYVGSIVAFALSWSIGANDVANTLGTSVGSGALSLVTASIVGGVCEFAGAASMGSSVSTSLANIVTVTVDPDDPSADHQYLIFQAVMLSSMIASFAWVTVATYFKWPVSTTHSVVGALVGAGIVVYGFGEVDYHKLIACVLSWISSPLGGGIFSFLIYLAVDKLVVSHPQPIRRAKLLVPWISGLAIAILTVFMMTNGPHVLRAGLPAYYMVVIFVGTTLAVASVVMLLVRRLPEKPMPKLIAASSSTSSTGKPGRLSQENGHHQEKAHHPGEDDGTNGTAHHRYHRHHDEISPGPAGLHREQLPHEPSTHPRSPRKESGVGCQLPMGESDLEEARAEEDNVEEGQLDDSEAAEEEIKATVEQPFRYLMILSAFILSYSHGANDVANSIGPLIAILEPDAYTAPGKASTAAVPFWVPIGGGVGIVVGLAMWGHRVIRTVGSKVTKLTFSRGFAVQFGTAMTVLAATALGIPVSTTHVLIGSLIGAALVHGRKSLNCHTLKSIFISWGVTIPIAAAVSMAFAAVFNATL